MSATPNSLGAADLAYRKTVGGGISGDNPTTGAGKLWLPIWSGEVINAYDEYNQFEGMVQSRTISSGTTVEIPITGTVDLKPAWNAGEELMGGKDAKASTYQIKLDDRPMAAHFELDNVDLMLTQWEYRSELARQAALTLANTRDKQIYSYLVRAAATSQIDQDPRPGLNLDDALYGETGSSAKKLNIVGTKNATVADRATGALSMLAYIEEYLVYLQENNIPFENLMMAVSPRVFMDIRSLGVARQSTDFQDGGNQPYFGGVADEGGLGAPYTQGLSRMTDSLEYMGVNIIKTNHGSDQLRDKSGTATDPGGGTEEQGLGQAKYNLDFTCGLTDTTTPGSETIEGVRAVMFTPEAVGAIRLQGLKVDTVDDVRRNTTFTVASMMSGTGVLRPECAAVIVTNREDDPNNDGNKTTSSSVAGTGVGQSATKFGNTLTRAYLRNLLHLDADGYVKA